MRFFLTSRDIIADSIEAAMGGHNVDAFVSSGARDKNMPGSMDCHCQYGYPSDLCLWWDYCSRESGWKDIDLVSVFGVNLEMELSDMTAEEVKQLECNACLALVHVVECIQ